MASFSSVADRVGGSGAGSARALQVVCPPRGLRLFCATESAGSIQAQLWRDRPALRR
jgi:hypothetical protein